MTGETMPDHDPSDQTRAWLRTVVPGVWAAIIARAAALGVPNWITEPLGGVAETIVVPIVLTVIYPLLRGLEGRLPPAVTRVLLGSAVPPPYSDQPAGRHTIDPNSHS